MADKTDYLGLEGKVCAITGAGGGIGRAVAVALAEVGARPVLLDRDADACAETAAVLAEVGVTAPCIACDVSDQGSVTAAAKAAGPCDVLVNNAGLVRPGPLATLPLEEWNQLMAVNLTGYFLCAQAFGAAMVQRGSGAIVHVASIAGSHPQAFSGAYSVSKAGVLMLSRLLALEWGPSGVRSNVVSPGLVRTPMSEAFYQAPGVAQRRAEIVPAGRVAVPKDIADVVVFLASARAGYVNGEEIGANGGFAQVLMSMVPRPGFDK